VLVLHTVAEGKSRATKAQWRWGLTKQVAETAAQNNLSVSKRVISS
jgi:hypothetical protein